MSLNLAQLLRSSAHANPKKTALVLGDVKLDYGTVHTYAQRVAGGLRQLGVQPGTHVALMIPNVPQFTIAYFGCHYAANPVLPLNVLLTADEILYHLNDADIGVLIVWEGFLKQAQAAFHRAESCTHLVIVKADPRDTSAPDGTHNLSELMGSAQPLTELTPTMPDDTAVILYTSGTTGRAKGAELSHFNMFYNARYAQSELLGLDANTVGLATLPLFHSFGQTAIQNAIISAGGTVVLLPRFVPTDALDAMQKHKVTLFGGVPTMYFALLHHPQADAYDLSSLTRCVSGGSAMPVEVMKAFDDKYNVNILEGYGLSETSPIASFNVLDKPKKAGSIGLPIWGVEFKLIDSDENTITDSDIPGEICIKGHNVMKGYYKRPEVNAKTIVDGWFRTGDVATRDADGYYFIVDRIKDMIIRGGYNVYPREIEEVLYAHPAIVEAAVVGVPHERHGEEVKAVVAFKDGQSATQDELIAYCKDRLAAYKYPRIFEVVDSLPKGATGKILKRELRTR